MSGRVARIPLHHERNITHLSAGMARSRRPRRLRIRDLDRHTHAALPRVAAVGDGTTHRTSGFGQWIRCVGRNAERQIRPFVAVLHAGSDRRRWSATHRRLWLPSLLHRAADAYIVERHALPTHPAL